jgi:hypothetical protein
MFLYEFMTRELCRTEIQEYRLKITPDGMGAGRTGIQLLANPAANSLDRGQILKQLLKGMNRVASPRSRGENSRSCSQRAPTKRC